MATKTIGKYAKITADPFCLPGDNNFNYYINNAGKIDSAAKGNNVAITEVKSRLTEADQKSIEDLFFVYPGKPRGKSSSSSKKYKCTVGMTVELMNILQAMPTDVSFQEYYEGKLKFQGTEEYLSIDSARVISDSVYKRTIGAKYYDFRLNNRENGKTTFRTNKFVNKLPLKDKALLAKEVETFTSSTLFGIDVMRIVELLLSCYTKGYISKKTFISVCKEHKIKKSVVLEFCLFFKEEDLWNCSVAFHRRIKKLKGEVTQARFEKALTQSCNKKTFNAFLTESEVNAIWKNKDDEECSTDFELNATSIKKRWYNEIYKSDKWFIGCTIAHIKRTLKDKVVAKDTVDSINFDEDGEDVDSEDFIEDQEPVSRPLPKHTLQDIVSEIDEDRSINVESINGSNEKVFGFLAIVTPKHGGQNIILRTNTDKKETLIKLCEKHLNTAGFEYTTIETTKLGSLIQDTETNEIKISYASKH